MKGKKKITKYIALGLSIALIVAGVLFIMTYENHTSTGEGLSRANTNIEFGADFYTSSAQYTALAANAATDIYGIVKTAVGIFFIFVGGISSCSIIAFWDRFCKNEPQNKVNIEKEM